MFSVRGTFQRTEKIRGISEKMSKLMIRESPGFLSSWSQRDGFGRETPGVFSRRVRGALGTFPVNSFPL